MIRVFARRTNATPTDALAFYDVPGLFRPPVDLPVCVSCAFTADKDRSEWLAESWRRWGYNVQVGGPAYDDAGVEFTPGRFLKLGYTITSRGCPNNCWFCLVPKREGKLREYGIKPGRIVTDNNLTACSHRHIEAVFSMLAEQRGGIEFAGGLEAERVDDWFIEQLRRVSVKQMFLAYDDPTHDKVVSAALARLTAAGFKRWQLRCYVLAGQRNDTPTAARHRVEQVLEWGGLPFMMLYQPDVNAIDYPQEWRHLQREFTRPAAMLRHRLAP